MVRRWVMLALALLVTGAQAKLPANLDEFKDRIAAEAGEPKGAMHLWFEALYLYLMEDPDRSRLGAAAMDLICSDAKWRDNELFQAQLRNKPYIFRSYCEGATPDNGYQMNPDAFQLRYGRELPEDDGQSCLLELKSSGADRVRPARLVRQGGHWWIAEYGNLYAGVEPPRE